MSEFPKPVYAPEYTPVNGVLTINFTLTNTESYSAGDQVIYKVAGYDINNVGSLILSDVMEITQDGITSAGSGNYPVPISIPIGEGVRCIALYAKYCNSLDPCNNVTDFWPDYTTFYWIGGL